MKEPERFRMITLFLFIQSLVSVYAVEPLQTTLVGGRGFFEGRVEVYYHRSWRTVCDDGFDLNDAHVICHTLGYQRASAYNLSASFGEGTGEILLDNVECTGTESNIAFCRHNGYYNHNCGHHNDVGVICDGVVYTRNLYYHKREGRVDVNYQGSWGTVCADGFGLAEANVVCRMVGYTFAESYSSCCPYFEEGDGDIHHFNCTGEEVNIGHCSHNPLGTNICGHHDDVGVTCTKLPVRLVGGDTPNEGRVEVLQPNTRSYWGTICSDSWDINDATVVCRMLGYPGVSSAMKSFGPGSGNIILDNVDCDGSETHLTQCNHAGYLVHNCDHIEDVGVVCSGQAELGVRLVDGPDESQGRVELFYFGAWGTVCHHVWTLLDSHVVCKMLGFIGAIGYSSHSSYGPGTGEFLLFSPRCTGNETSLLDCHLGYSFGVTYCNDHTTDIGVSCLKWDDLQVRLVNGRSNKEGRVEVLYSGTWGTVCDDKWDLEDSDVVCRMLGFERAENFSCCAGFGPGPGPILLEDVECEGTESNIGHCLRSAYEVHNCDHSEDVGVSCIEYGVNQESSTTMAAETTETLSSGDMTNDGRKGISQAAAKGSIGFLSVVVIGILLVCIIMTLVMQKYRRIAMNRQPSNPNCYDGPQRGKDGTMELNTVSGTRIKDESSTNQADMYESLQHVDSRDLSYEVMQKRDK